MVAGHTPPKGVGEEFLSMVRIGLVTTETLREGDLTLVGAAHRSVNRTSSPRASSKTISL